MKIGLFSPYLDTLGGGERYMMTAGLCLAQKGHRVDVFWDDKRLKKKLAQRLNLSLGKLKFVRNIFASGHGLRERWRVTRNYDVIVYLSDGSIPFLFAKKNLLHFQVPFHGVSGRKWLNQAKLKRIRAIICNSKFTKGFIDREYRVNSEVIYPPVGVEDFRPGEKAPIILGVGRFSQSLHAKKQAVLISAFRQLAKKLPGWRLVLVGGAREEDKSFIDRLRQQAKSFPIKIMPNVKFSQLKQLYSQAKIFWHAAGYGENEKKHPERMEHFGIVVVEAMAAGCVPIVIKRGGIPEIIRHQKNGWGWETKEELVKTTIRLAQSEEKWQQLSSQAVKDSQQFSQKVFCRKINEIINR